MANCLSNAPRFGWAQLPKANRPFDLWVFLWSIYFPWPQKVITFCFQVPEGQLSVWMCRASGFAGRILGCREEKRRPCRLRPQPPLCRRLVPLDERPGVSGETGVVFDKVFGEQIKLSYWLVVWSGAKVSGGITKKGVPSTELPPRCDLFDTGSEESGLFGSVFRVYSLVNRVGLPLGLNMFKPLVMLMISCEGCV